MKVVITWNDWTYNPWGTFTLNGARGEVIDWFIAIAGALQTDSDFIVSWSDGSYTFPADTLKKCRIEFDFID